MSPDLQEKELDKYQSWVEIKLQKRDQLKAHYQDKNYEDVDEIVVGSRTYKLSLEKSSNKNYSGKLLGGVLHLKLAKEDSTEGRSKAIRHLISRLIAMDFYPWVEERVEILNRQHFNQRYNQISLKYNLSNWGSCSSRRNINLSTCLLFAPVEVIDYVIIHELAHLVEMNHSKKFWALVERAMPDYKEKITWLKKNWASCRF